MERELRLGREGAGEGAAAAAVVAGGTAGSAWEEEGEGAGGAGGVEGSEGRGRSTKRILVGHSMGAAALAESVIADPAGIAGEARWWEGRGVGGRSGGGRGVRVRVRV